ncbi:hypothetical protein CPB83DRAFT_449857 [Crepidotus variabilis]|uniref:Uncharacterized protein n=1 Tax=Crepidotus variabilis TaxID=179855 RepID=A0A9P6JNK9_9AGAR|nr:hypothetical protein CPB83DRAFT_449857 [Crepidotus variabilis]
MVVLTSLIIISGFATSALAAPFHKLEARSQGIDLETREPKIDVVRIGHLVNKVANAAQNTANIAATVGSVIPQRQTAQYYQRDLVDDSELDVREPSILSAALHVSHAVDSLTHHNHRRDLEVDEVDARGMEDSESMNIRNMYDEVDALEGREIDEDETFDARGFDEEDLDAREVDEMEEESRHEDDDEEDMLARGLDTEYEGLD